MKINDLGHLYESLLLILKNTSSVDLEHTHIRNEAKNVQMGNQNMDTKFQRF